MNSEGKNSYFWPLENRLKLLQPRYVAKKANNIPGVDGPVHGAHDFFPGVDGGGQQC